jgi:hypothetical protein
MDGSKTNKLEVVLKNLKDIGILNDYDLKNFSFKIKSVTSTISYMEKIVIKSFKQAFPGTLIRKNAVDLYLAELFNRYTNEEGLSKDAALVAMLISLEQENMNGLTTLTPFLQKQFAKYDFEKVNLQ